jgi:DNA-directed RNA polymerase subunit RPC12/RpoP
MARLECMFEADDDREELEWIHELQMKAEAEEKEIYSIETDDKKPDISVCPYCNGRMFLSFSDGDRSVNSTPYRGYSPIRGGDAVQYKCGYCGASSPKVYLRLSLLDENRIKTELQREIEGAIAEIKREEEGDCDD